MKALHILVIGTCICISSLFWIPINTTILIIQASIGFIIAIYASFKIK